METTQPTILIVDDHAANRWAMHTLLGGIGAHLIEAGSGNEALAIALEQDLAVILLDANMPGMDGYEVAELLRQEPRTAHIPVIFLTAVYRDPEHRARGYAAGAVDYLEKPVDKHLLGSKVQVFIQLWERTHKLKTALHQVETARRHLEREIERRQVAEAGLRESVRLDPLTGLHNRLAIDEGLRRELARAERHGERFALLFLDLDRFKPVNDRFGHQAGDQVLRETAQRLSNCVRQADTLARFGGDEFMILMPEIRECQDILPLAQRVEQALAAPVPVEGGEAALGVSIGIACYPEDGTEADALLDGADKAMYAAKQGGGGYAFAGECVDVPAASGRVGKTAGH
jgi:diguanylate cyclase (GGDEF)-like protein